MRKVLVSIMALLLMLPLVAKAADVTPQKDPQYAPNAIDTTTVDYQKTPLNKLGRGVVNSVTFWAEVPAQFFKVSKESNPLVGAVVGGANGVALGVLRCATGLIDVVTFLFPPYDKPLMKPEYALQGANQNMETYLSGK